MPLNIPERLAVETALNTYGGGVWADVENPLRLSRVFTSMLERWPTNMPVGSEQDWVNRFHSARRRLGVEPFERGTAAKTYPLGLHVLVPHFRIENADALYLPPSTTVLREWMQAQHPIAAAVSDLPYHLGTTIHSHRFRSAPFPSQNTAEQWADLFEHRYPWRSAAYAPHLGLVWSILERVGQGLPLEGATPTAPAGVDVPETVDLAWFVDTLMERNPSEVRALVEQGAFLFLCDARLGTMPSRSLTTELRNRVRNVGATGFTGGAARSLEALLETVVERVAGTPLTDEEHRQRFTLKMQEVAMAASREGKRNNMCSVLDRTLESLGVHKMEPPPQEVVVQVDGYHIKITIPAWEVTTDRYSLAVLARNAWGNMTEAQRKAAVVKAPDVPVIRFDSADLVPETR